MKKHHSQPDRDDPGHIGSRPHFQNNATTQKATRAPRSVSARGWWPPSRPMRNVVVASSAALLILLIFVLLVIQPWASPSNPLGGVDLTNYCSLLGSTGSPAYVVADSSTECVQKINLDSACFYTHRSTANPTFKLTNPSDPDSGTCINRATNSSVGGIENMSGYCTTLTKAMGVTATAENPDYKNTWVCEVAINMDLACEETYSNTPNTVAREVNGSWTCYD